MATNYGPAGIPLDAAGNLALGVLTPTTAPITGTLTTNGDTVVLPISGGQWATAKFIQTGAGTSTLSTQISIDGGTNWIAAAYGKAIGVVSTNPVVNPLQLLSTANGTWEIPLPANATHFRLLCTGTGTTTTVTLSGGALYTPGMPVTAVLYDVTEGSIGAGFNSGTLDVSGWQSFSVQAVNPTTQVIAIKEVDDTGATPFNGYSGTAASVNTFTFSRLGGFPQATGTPGASQQAAYVVNLKRINVTQPAGGTVSTARARLVASR